MSRIIVCLDDTHPGKGGKILDIVNHSSGWWHIRQAYTNLGYDKDRLGYMDDNEYGRKWYKQNGYK